MNWECPIKIASVLAFALASYIPTGAFADDLPDGNWERRAKPWVNLISEENQKTVGISTKEQSNTAIVGESLESTWDRARRNTGFTDLTSQIDSNDDRLADIEDRMVDLETLIEQSWDELPASSSSSFMPSGSPANYSSWSPAITSQTSDFTQSRSYDQVFTKEYQIFEENTFTGERRLKDTTTESETRSLTERRTIDVSRYASGGTDGWSSWSSTSGIYNCTGFSPATSTVDDGVSYTQSRTCKQNQRRTIYYLASSSVIDQSYQNRVASITQTRSAVGTKPVCRYDEDGTYVLHKSTSGNMNGDHSRSYDIWYWGRTQLRWTSSGGFTNGPHIIGSYEYWKGAERESNSFFGSSDTYSEICRRRL